MTPKEKAEELYKKYFNELPPSMCSEEEYSIRAYNCAMFCVDEILNVVYGVYDYDAEVLIPYWEEVKQELEKLK